MTIAPPTPADPAPMFLEMELDGALRTSLDGASLDMGLSGLELDVLEPDEIAAGVRLVLDDDGTLTVEDGYVAIETDTGTIYRWRCAVCGYIHEAPNPPRWCPLCGADSTQFEALVDGQP